ncbi:cupin domain-containing protein [Haloarcula sp. S1AR25-5A]|uniref:Cupin domain-containing protein n=1 Tax=Haloarcula terrestris TaxID=2950533 RepID=A0AAE4EUL7_9EURY|nr:cupin domain-containing protein [Haloarcula terrestris]MDS0219764.1 cupin domain-containing protein [Haloarcula terrestris]
MTVKTGRSVGGPENYHADSDQWLFVVGGTGVVTVDGDTQRIETGERHGIENDRNEPLETVNFYTPPR